jgi:hypothetical protein
LFIFLGHALSIGPKKWNISPPVFHIPLGLNCGFSYSKVIDIPVFHMPFSHVVFESPGLMHKGAAPKVIQAPNQKCFAMMEPGWFKHVCW